MQGVYLRNVLLTITSLLIVIGLFIAALPFARSMKPSARAIADLPRINLDNINLGEYKIVTKHIIPDLYNGRKWGVLIIRKNNGEFDIYDILFSGNKVAMPDIHWWKSYEDCENFGPTTINGKIVENKPITCHDQANFSEWSKQEWRWSLSGNNLGKYTDDLPKTRGTIKNNVFVFSTK